MTWRRRYGQALLTRAGMFLLALLVVLTLNFALPRVMPGDPITGLYEPDSSLYASDDTTREALVRYYGLDQPVVVQYAHYLGGLLTGDIGWSIRQHRPVTELIMAHLPWTLALTVPALILATVISLLAGSHAGWRRGSAMDRVLISFFASVHTLPPFFVGILAILLFAVSLGWVPPAGARTPFAEYPDLWAAIGDLSSHWLLPVAVLTLQTLGGQFLLMRNSVITVLGEDFMLVARAKGLGQRRLLYRHALRNTVLPFVTVFSMQFGLTVTGAIIIESLFAYPGMGWLVFQAIGARDYPLLQGVFLVISVMVLVANLAADLAYAKLDPRVALAS